MWIGLVFILIHPVGLQMGQAAFLVLIMSIMVPPSAPFVQFVEIMFNLFFYLSLAWAWCALGTRVAEATRGPVDPAKVAEKMAQYAGDSPQIQQMRVVSHLPSPACLRRCSTARTSKLARRSCAACGCVSEPPPS